MKRCLFFLLAVCLLASCGEDEYHYLSVKLEFLTAYSDSDGQLQYVLTDAGERLDVIQDGTGLAFGSDSVTRIVTNYLTLSDDEGGGAKLYAGIYAVSPFPLPVDAFEEGICTDPAQLLSIWLGLDYLNVVLTVKAQNGKHVFRFVEEQVTEGEEAMDVYLLLHHDAGDDVQAYTQRIYLSVPLQKYVARAGSKRLVLHFSLYTSGEEVREYVFN